MPAITLGASHLATDNWEIQRTNNFEISITGLDLIVGSEKAEDLTLAVESGFLPAENSNVQQLYYGNSQVKVAGTNSYNNGTLVVKDSVSKDIEDVIRLWRRTVYNPDTDQVGIASQYKLDGRVLQYAPDGSIERTWILEGLFPSGVDYGQVTYTSQGAIKTISITLEYDRAYREDKVGL